MSVRIQLIVGGVLIAAVVFFVLQWCESGPVNMDSLSSPDAGSPGVISVSPFPENDTEPERSLEGGHSADVREMGQTDQGSGATTGSPGETEPGLGTTDEHPDTESSATTSDEDEETDPTEPENVPPPGISDDPADAEFQTQLRGVLELFRNDMMECYELLLELEPDVAADLVFELVVRADPDDPTLSDVELISVTSGPLALDNVACFAEAAAELELPPPTGEGEYTVRHSVAMRANEEGE